MFPLNSHPAGRHFLQIPGPTNVPDRVLRAIDQPTIDHRGPEFALLGLKILRDIRTIFKTEQPVVIYPASGTGAWEAALVNTLSPGDKVVMVETGQFATLWKKMADKLELDVEFISTDWRRGVPADEVQARLEKDGQHAIKAVCVVHNETSTGVTSNIAAVRKAIDAAKHPALLLVDTISGLGSADYRHDEWGVDVTVAGSQKGLMLPPGLSFNAVSRRRSRRRRVPSTARPTGAGRRSSPPTPTATGRRRRRPTCSTDSPKRSTCCSPKGWTTSSRVITATPRRRAARCAPGAWRCCARTRPSTARR